MPARRPVRPRTHPVVLAGAMLVVVGAAAAGIWAGSYGGRPRPQPIEDPELASRLLPTADTTTSAVAERGADLFEQRCARCHTVGGGDRKEGPDLAQRALGRDLTWVRAMVAAPDSMFRTDSLAQWMLEVHGMKRPSFDPDDPDLKALAAFFASFDMGR